MSSPRAPISFRVDTHVFRELGELLVGRDSTALNELVKNAYDADATTVTVHGEGLSGLTGAITITDDGNGMTRGVFEQGFLTIAGRTKEGEDRRSVVYRRRFTGSKGIGRLAAHKLGRTLGVATLPKPVVFPKATQSVDAFIDWDAVEEMTQLADTAKIAPEREMGISEEPLPESFKPGTTIRIGRLRHAWSPKDQAALISELEALRVPPALLDIQKGAILDRNLLLETIKPAETAPNDPGFEVTYSGDLDVGQSYWDNLVADNAWILEIDALSSQVKFQVTPFRRTIREIGGVVRNWTGSVAHPEPTDGPFFCARILIRQGPSRVADAAKEWARRQGGIRVYVEGFRVLPYGDAGDDWLKLDREYARRVGGSFPYLESYLSGLTGDTSEWVDDTAGHSILPNSNYFGAVFLTQEGAKNLRMVVSREGFVPDASFRTLVELTRLGIDISVRHRAAAQVGRRDDWRKARNPTKDKSERGKAPPKLKDAPAPERLSPKLLVGAARVKLASGDVPGAVRALDAAVEELTAEESARKQAADQAYMYRVLASLGLQMHAFVHDVSAMVSMTAVVDRSLQELRAALPFRSLAVSSKISHLQASIEDLKRQIERQASALSEVSSPDSRRKRGRHSLSERFDAAVRILGPIAERRRTTIVNEIPGDLRSPPMFAAELTIIFTNLLTNAIKASGAGGNIRASGSMSETEVWVRIENTGVAVDLAESERWFKPFESTTERPDPILGQGMGMGLPIARNVVESLGGMIDFVEPSAGFATAVKFQLPVGT